MTNDNVLLNYIDCIPINPENPFIGYEKILTGWSMLSDRLATEMVRGNIDPTDNKSPISDVTFEYDGVTYVKPAPAFGGESEFYVNGRPRKSVPEAKVTIFCAAPALSYSDWQSLRELLGDRYSNKKYAWI